jgi:hypothetical protein
MGSIEFRLDQESEEPDYVMEVPKKKEHWFHGLPAGLQIGLMVLAMMSPILIMLLLVFLSGK